MSFAVRLAEDLYRVEPGTTAAVSINVSNRAAEADRYEFSVEGLDPAWSAVPVPAFSVPAGETQTERFFLKAPKDAESRAGTYPFVVTLRSLESGEVRTAQGALEIRPYFNLSLDIQPKKGTLSPLSRSAAFQVTLMNLSNSEHTLQLFAADNDGLFAFEFDTDQVILEAGQQRTVALQAAGTRSALLANSRLQNFSVSARSVENPALGANASGQIEQKAMASPGAFMLMLLLAALLVGWVMLWPKPPVISSVVVSPERTMVGQPVDIKWRALRAQAVKVQIGNWVQDRQLPEGSMTFVPDKAGKFAVEVTAMSGDRSARDVSKIIEVSEPAPVPDPEIREFSVDQRVLKLGQTFMLNYKFNDAVVKAMIYPMQKELDVKAGGIQLTADATGKTKYQVKAYNAAGKSVESAVTVTVVKPSKAQIVAFEVKPLEFDEKGGTATIDFAVAGAVRVELQNAGAREDVSKLLAPDAATGRSTGHTEVPVTQDTTFKLIAYDDEGIAVASATVKVTVKKPPPTDASPDASPTTGGGQ